MTKCICGHDISLHQVVDCMTTINNINDFCGCELEPADAIKEAELAELREKLAAYENTDYARLTALVSTQAERIDTMTDQIARLEAVAEAARRERNGEKGAQNLVDAALAELDALPAAPHVAEVRERLRNKGLDAGMADAMQGKPLPNSGTPNLKGE